MCIFLIDKMFWLKITHHYNQTITLSQKGLIFITAGKRSAACGNELRLTSA